MLSPLLIDVLRSSIASKGSIFFADKMAMKGSLLKTLKEARY